eukprot:TRINITY_DN6697_c0_g1_i1.p1 TRINITY_DN6697_c0_g1~~TRINITY_DN6697_c0_g1_i1.p1  ORF type:complete len:207 (+),score=28.13 TRINITY_DN6697_c0_g1_i1:519-1139(+)
MGYYSTDKPFPRGEIIAKAPTMSPGYFNMPEKTKEVFIDGWYYTGDIGTFDAEGKLHIIDRKTDYLELYSCGRSVWVSAAYLERIYGNSSKIKQIFLHGDRALPFLVAVVVPRREFIDSVSTKSVDQTYESVCMQPEVIDSILSDVNSIGKQNNLQEYEIPVGIVIEPYEWTIENGLLTPTGKQKRYQILNKYKLQIDLELTKHCH